MQLWFNEEQLNSNQISDFIENYWLSKEFNCQSCLNDIGKTRYHQDNVISFSLIGISEKVDIYLCHETVRNI